MFSLTVWLALFLFHIIVAGVAIAWVAPAVGSKARFRAGILTMLIVYAINIALVWADRTFLPKMDDQPASILLAQGVAILLPGLFIALALFRRSFKLSWGRAFAPWGIHVAFIIAFAALIYGVIQQHVSKSFRIPTGSMQPTLEPGDQFWVNRLAQPKRFDLLAFISDQPGSPIYIKRLVALPGEGLRFQNNHVYINDQLLQTPPAMHGQFAGSNPAFPLVKESQTIQLGPNDFFLIGDDLDRSLDSRMTGPTDRSKLIGVADFRFLPISRIGFLR